jgi:hypothetical protein
MKSDTLEFKSDSFPRNSSNAQQNVFMKLPVRLKKVKKSSTNLKTENLLHVSSMTPYLQMQPNLQNGYVKYVPNQTKRGLAQQFYCP